MYKYLAITNELVVKAICALAICVVGCERSALNQLAEETLPRGNRVVEAPTDLDLGVIECGGKVTTSCPITNRSNSSVTVGYYTTTCDCVTTHSIPFRVEREERRAMEISIDMKGDSFAGSLAPEVVLLDEHRNELARIRLLIEVVSAEE